MKHIRPVSPNKEFIGFLLLALSSCLGVALVFSQAHAYEVWVTDQSDTAEKSGGYLYIYDGSQLTTELEDAKPTHQIDMGTNINSLCKKATGKAVRRPHMVFFTKDNKYAVIAFLSGQVLFMDADSKTPLGCMSVGKNVHALRGQLQIRKWLSLPISKRSNLYGYGLTILLKNSLLTPEKMS